MNLHSSISKQPIPEVAEGLHELFVDGLKDIYWAEQALTLAIPKMIEKATSKDLKNALTMHLEETENQVKRLESVFKAIDESPEAKKCEAMAGLVKEAGEIMDSTKSGVVRDAGIIAAAQKVEHYEIATYGTLRTFAEVLGEDDAMELLQESLDEEKNADVKLTKIAVSHVNSEASDLP